LTEAAKLLVFSAKPIIDISLIGGYESQQAFTSIFKAMYKITPAEFRAAEQFYPLQLEIELADEPIRMDFTTDDIRLATLADTGDWLELVALAIDGYPRLDEAEYLENLRHAITEDRAFILRDEGMAIGLMSFTPEAGSIDFLAVHPQYRNLGITKLFIDKLASELLVGKELSLTTYRAGDKADTGYRKELDRLGFAERELLIEYGYPTQRFVLPLKHEEDTTRGGNSE
jgi:GNAT superfamily N-acetyltransferase